MVWQWSSLLNSNNNILILPENDIVIVLAGPAGLGLGAIEIAASVFKAKVIAVSDTEDSSSLIRDEGAEKAVCMSEGVPAVYKFLREAIGKNRAAVIYDAVGQGHLHTFQDLLVDEERTFGQLKLIISDPLQPLSGQGKTGHCLSPLRNGPIQGKRPRSGD